MMHSDADLPVFHFSLIRLLMIARFMYSTRYIRHYFPRFSQLPFTSLLPSTPLLTRPPSCVHASNLHQPLCNALYFFLVNL